jgi:two-component system, NtrC family, response regulator AtoC
MNILLIEDSASQREILQGFLSKKGFKIVTAQNGEEGLRKYEENEIDLVISDFKMPLKNGLEVLREIKQLNPFAAVMIITAFSDVNDAVQVIKAGAADYILKPVDLEELYSKITQIGNQLKINKESEEVFYELPDKEISENFIGKSEKIKEILSIVRRVAFHPVTVLISGESGTGKEMIADLIHEFSPRRNKKLVKVNCAALSGNLLESELFGHVKGSFTGAFKDRKGRFEEADGGTLFLDEIGEISPQIQVKLLRVLQNMTFEPVGSSSSVQVDVRIIAATNKKLEDELLKGTFREDLFYRLNVVPISMPPLRERKEDIPLLIEHFLNEYNPEKKVTFTSQALLKLISYKWEGNIRQLKNIVTRVVTLSRNNQITVEDLPKEIYDSNKTTETEDPIKLETVEKEHIKNVLKLCEGNQKKAAEMMGIHRNTLAKKIKDYKISI